MAKLFDFSRDQFLGDQNSLRRPWVEMRIHTRILGYFG
jgi:hypothetical protein